MSKSKTKSVKKSKPKTAKSEPIDENKLSERAKNALAEVKVMGLRENSKTEMIVKLLKRPEGATIQDLIDATGWQAHSIRSTITDKIVKQKGFKVIKEKPKTPPTTFKIVEE